MDTEDIIYRVFYEWYTHISGTLLRILLLPIFILSMFLGMILYFPLVFIQLMVMIVKDD